MDKSAAFLLFDIRGEFPELISDRFAFHLGVSLSTLRSPKKVLVASDLRLTSPELKGFLIDGFAFSGVEVSDLGEAPISLFYYALSQSHFDLGVMVTASHLGTLNNGFKLANADGLPFDQRQILEVKKAFLNVADQNIIVPRLEIPRVDFVAAYVSDMISILGPLPKIQTPICVDLTRSSATGPVLVALSKLGWSYFLVDSNHEGNPLMEENRRDLAKKVIETGSCLGIIFDSDGDRVIFVDEKGELISPHFVLGALGADKVGAKGPGSRIAVDVRSGMIVKEMVEDAGGKIVLEPAWGQFIKFAAKEDKAIVFGGEISGHFVHPDFHFIDDGLLTALEFRLLWEKESIREKRRLLSKKYFELPEKNFPCRFDLAPIVLDAICEYYRKREFLVSIEDGVSVWGLDFKFNIRESATEPLLRINLETKSGKTAGEILSKIENLIEEAAHD